VRTKSYAPLKHVGTPIEEIDLTEERGTRAAAAASASFTFSPELSLKGVHVPVLTPLVNEDVPGSPTEPVFDSAVQSDIQGNIIPGFNKDHQHFLFLRIRNPKRAKVFLREILPRISTMEEVIAFRRLYRSRRFLLGRHNTYLCSTWVNIAFSRRGIELLANKADADAFGDRSFQFGLAQRSSYLGDPTSPAHRGSARRWRVGGPRNEADIVLILASDHVAVLDDLVALLKLRARDAALKLLFEQRGDTLPGDLRGHEHFGFKDGISQPGVRGKLSPTPGDYITPRYIAAGDSRRLYLARPGQQLAWPGQFLLGEQRQSTEDQLNAVGAASNFPKWARRGSYLVVRRLQQDVPAFYSFVALGAARTGITRDKFAAMLIGRWPSGAPILRVPAGDNPALGDDDFANNHFIFDDDTPPSSLGPIPGYPGDTYPQAVADFLAQVCPHFAHIRKVHPRDTATEMGKPADSFTRMILRRGIPYGPQLVGVKNPKRALIAEDRGLMFLCYGASIEDQFEFLQRRWSNSGSQPNLGGFDPIIGQNGRRGSRVRFIDFPTPAGTVRIRIKNEWVTPTGGGYFFAPSISAIRDVLAA
jgi:Dyp-type peroxidase family